MSNYGAGVQFLGGICVLLLIFKAFTKDMGYKFLYTLFIYIAVAATAMAQEKVVQNRPYTDLRPIHFGIVVGGNMQDLEFNNVGPQTLTLQDGSQIESLVTCDQHNWDGGFNVGVLAEFRMNQYFAFRLAPQLYFGTRSIAFYNFMQQQDTGAPMMQRQSMKTVYVGANCDIIFASQRFNNHRPYIMAGIAPMANLSTRANDYIQLKSFDIFAEIGLGLDLYLPFFKLRPELKFMYGLTNALNTKHAGNLRDAEMLPYAASVNKATSKMIVLSFYFE